MKTRYDWTSMDWYHQTLLLLAVTIAQAAYGDHDNGFGNETLLCNSTISKANASGIYTFAVDYPTKQFNASSGPAEQNIPDPSWALTVDVAQNTTQTTLWYDTAGQNYSNDLGIGYDACAFVVSSLPQNTIRLGQDDPGDCSSMFSQPCRDAILTRAASSAQQWTTYSSPPPYNNLTAGVLPTLCGYIYADLGDDGKAYPKECAQELGYDYNINHVEAYNRNVGTLVQALTGYNSSFVDEEACTLQDQAKTFNLVSTQLSTDADAYDIMTRTIMPILSVYFTVANYDRTSATSWANSTMSCVRAKNFSEGSRVSPVLPKGTPYHYGGSSLSGGSIASIVVGVLVFVAIMAFFAFWLWRRRRRQARLRRKVPVEADGYETKEMGGEARYELKSDDRKLEKDSGPISELGGGRGKTAELEGARAVEIDGRSKPAELGV